MDYMLFFIGVVALACITTVPYLLFRRFTSRHQKQLDEVIDEMNFYKEAIDGTDMILWKVDLMTMQWWVHEDFYRLFAYEDPGTYFGFDWFQDKIAKHDIDLISRTLNQLTPKQAGARITIKLLRDGKYTSWVHVVARGRFDSNDSLVSISGSVSNIDNIVATEEALKSAYNRVEKTTELNSSFLSTMSHEVRTPLNAIAGYAQLIKREITDAKVLKHVEEIKFSTDNLIKVMSDIIEAGNAETGSIQLKSEKTDVTELVKALKHKYQAEADKKGICLEFELDIDDHSCVLIDNLRLNQVLDNLINNAVKYTDHGYVKLTYKKEKYAFSRIKMQFRVEDTGRGINNQKILNYINGEKDEDINLVAQNGLGLSIVYNLVRMMKGSIKVDSFDGYGTIFDVTINGILAADLYTDKVMSSDNLMKSIHMDNNKNILVVEDNEINQALIVDMLNILDIHNIDVSNNGQEAMEYFTERDYDMVLTDIQMPVMDGVELTKKIRGLGSEIPIVALTANVLDDQLEAYYDVGINDYLAKPLSFGDLSTMMVNYLT